MEHKLGHNEKDNDILAMDKEISRKKSIKNGETRKREQAQNTMRSGTSGEYSRNRDSKEDSEYNKIV